jgi:hypothetical protein
MPLLSTRARNHSAQRSPEQVHCLSSTPVCFALLYADLTLSGHCTGTEQQRWVRAGRAQAGDLHRPFAQGGRRVAGSRERRGA